MDYESDEILSPVAPKDMSARRAARIRAKDLETVEKLAGSFEFVEDAYRAATLDYMRKYRELAPDEEAEWQGLVEKWEGGADPLRGLEGFEDTSSDWAGQLAFERQIINEEAPDGMSLDEFIEWRRKNAP